MPKFTVILPCYNAAATITATIAALQAQTCTDWEAICIDDASTDITPHLLATLAADDPRIRVLRQDNAGPSVARNRGAARAEGEILAFLDADDLWLPGKLASVAQALEAAPEADAIFGRVALFETQDGPDTAVSTVRAGRQVRSDVMGENPSCTLSNLSVRRAAFARTGGFDVMMRHAEDLEWMIRAVVSGCRIHAVDEVHVRYRTSRDGLSADLDAMHAGWRRAVADHATPDERDAAEARHLRYLARRALRTDASASTALAFALRGLRLAPFAFLGDRYRGPLTLAACLVASFLPLPLRHRAFA